MFHLPQLNHKNVMANSAVLVLMSSKGSAFESRQDQELLLFYIVQTGSGTHPISHSVSTGDLVRFPALPDFLRSNGWEVPLVSIGGKAG
jgi:hypothetical protein